MPSFLSKVFGRKKSGESPTHRTSRRISDSSLLEGKFEAIPSTISPPPSPLRFPDDAHSPERGKEREGDKAGQFGSLKQKSKLQSSSPITDAPHLTLRLPGTVDKNGDSLVSSFNPRADESDDSPLTRRLTPAQTLLLIEACSKAITERGGLETLGVMRPHWHSASPEIQRKLTSLFILSLAQKSPEITLAPSTSPLAAFNSELEYTRSVHDIAAVFRWALRHLKLEGSSFGSSSSSDEWSWYQNFSEAERKSNYDPRVFTTKLVPEIPSSHATLLASALDIISSLAAHAEANGYSGSKLAKYFGFWLLNARRATGTEDWDSFYTRWEVSGRMLEHLFLCWLRDEDTKRPLPKRLQELVAQYPYTASSDPTADGLLTRPRFSTRRHDALFVRVEAVYADNAHVRSSRSPVDIFNDALKSEPKPDSGEYVYLWDRVKATATSGPDNKPLPAILSDDTINLLSLVSTDPKEQILLGISNAASTVVAPLSPVIDVPLSPIANGHGISVPARKPTLSPSPPQSPKDWAEFSSAGFGETTISRNFASTLLDKDVEVTEPPVQRKPSKQKREKSTVTLVESSPPSPNPKAAPEEPEGPTLVLVTTEIVQLDEAFVDFWRDAVVDPVSSNWPKFVIGELKHPLTPRSLPASSDGENSSTGGPVSWIIIEEKLRVPTPPPTPVISPAATLPVSLKVAPAPLQRSSSPRPSFGEKKSSSLSATLKRFSLFSSSRDDLEDASSVASGSGKKDSFSGKKKRPGIGKSPKISEMGEALSEEPEPMPEVPKKAYEPQKVEKTQQGGGAKDRATGVVGGAALVVASGDEGKVEAAKEEVVKTDAVEELQSASHTLLPPGPQETPTSEPVADADEPTAKDDVPVAGVSEPTPIQSTVEGEDDSSVPPAVEPQPVITDVPPPTQAATTDVGSEDAQAIEKPTDAESHPPTEEPVNVQEAA